MRVLCLVRRTTTLVLRNHPFMRFPASSQGSISSPFVLLVEDGGLDLYLFRFATVAMTKIESNPRIRIIPASRIKIGRAIPINSLPQLQRQRMCTRLGTFDFAGRIQEGREEFLVLALDFLQVAILLLE